MVFTMTDDDVVYVGPEFVATVVDVGENLRCKGIVYSDSHCEIRFDSSNDIFGVKGIDIITSARICELLPCFDYLNDEVIILVIEAVKCKTPECVQIISERVGKDRYDEIMARKIPERIIQAIIKEGSKEGNIYCLCDPDEITEEVRRGTISWHDEFRKLEIRTPEEYDQDRAKIKEVTARYEPLLVSYLEFSGTTEKFGDFVREIIAKAVEKKITKEYSDAMVVATAGVTVIAFAFKVRTERLVHFGSEVFQIAVLLEVENAEAWLERQGISCSDKEFMKALFAFQEIS
jgi:hypothetical protein